MAEQNVSSKAIDWQQLVTASWQLINRLAERRFGRGGLAEEAALAVIDRLLEDNGARLTGYSGRAPVSAYLAAVSWRLLEDFARKRYGRRRPPLWIRKLGGYWEKLYTLLCLERLEIMAAVASVSQRQRQEELRDLEEAAWTIRQQVTDCGAHQGLEVELDEQLSDDPHEEQDIASQAARLEQHERIELFRQLFQALTGSDERQSAVCSERMSALRITLSSEERLLLRLCFDEDLPVSQVGKMLGMSRFQVHGRLRRLLARLRRELAAAGLERDIIELLR